MLSFGQKEENFIHFPVQKMKHFKRYQKLCKEEDEKEEDDDEKISSLNDAINHLYRESILHLFLIVYYFAKFWRDAKNTSKN